MRHDDPPPSDGEGPQLLLSVVFFLRSCISYLLSRAGENNPAHYSLQLSIRLIPHAFLGLFSGLHYTILSGALNVTISRSVTLSNSHHFPLYYIYNLFFLQTHKGALLMSMDYGVMVPQGWRMDLVDIPDPIEAYEAMTRVAHEAEALGYHSIWLYDHFHTVPTPAQEVTFECWASTAALARDTKRVRIDRSATGNSQ